MFLKRFHNQNVIFLDIDGVFNVLGDIHLEPRVLVHHNWGTWQIRESYVDFLKQLSSLSNLDIYWVSSWQDEGNQLNQSVGIKDFKIAKDSEIKRIAERYKMAIQVDDEREFVIQGIRTDGQLGISETQMKQIIETFS